MGTAWCVIGAVDILLFSALYIWLSWSTGKLIEEEEKKGR